MYFRSRIYDSKYWKENCFALTAELLVDKVSFWGVNLSITSHPNPIMRKERYVMRKERFRMKVFVIFLGIINFLQFIIWHRKVQKK